MVKCKSGNSVVTCAPMIALFDISTHFSINLHRIFRLPSKVILIPNRT